MTSWKIPKSVIMPVSVLGAMLLGLTLGRLGRPQILERAVFLALFLMLYPSMLEVDLTSFRGVVARPRLVFAALFLNFFVSPLLVFGALHLSGEIGDSSLMVGITMYGSVPGGGMAPAFTGMLQGNVSLSVTIAAIGSILSLGMVPLWAKSLLGAQMEVPPLLMFKRLCFMILFPLVIAILTRRIVLRTKGESTFLSLRRRLKPVSGIGLSLMVFSISMLYGDRVRNEPFLILRIAVPVSGFIVAMSALSWLVGKALRSGYADKVALTMSTTAKNTAISVALVFSTYGADAALVNAIAGPLVQLPMLLGFVSLKNAQKRRGVRNVE